MKTLRLYYDDSHLTTFVARVLETTEVKGRPAAILARTAFYPEGGGQPADHGWLDGVEVVDVQTRADDEAVLHVLSAPLQRDFARGQVNWPRRWDHMQHHTGQHILSQCFLQVADAETVAFHLGAETTTIDLNKAKLDDSQVQQAEELANEIITRNLPVTARFVAPQAITRLPLRRPPARTEDIRVVEIAGFDWSACGGTHVRATGAVGLIKVVRTERRGADTRVHFLCGKRALADYSRKLALVQELTRHFTRGEDEILQAVENLEAEWQVARRLLQDAEGQQIAQEAERLLHAAPTVSRWRVVASTYRDRDAAWLRRLAATLREQSAIVAMLGLVDGAGKAQVIVARSDDVEVDASKWLRKVLEPLGGRGGGRPEWAQGGAPTAQGLEQALRSAAAALVDTGN